MNISGVDMAPVTRLDMPEPSGNALKVARVAAGLSQVEAAQLMGYPVQPGSRGGWQSRTWQALESPTDPRNMSGPTFAMFQLLTGQHRLKTIVDKAVDVPTTGT